MIYVYMNVTNRKHPNIYKQIFLDHWEGFKKDNPWYNTDHCNELVSKMLSCGDPKQIGFAEYQCLECGRGNRVVPMSCKSYLCLSCGKVHTDNWVCQVSKALLEGMIYRHIVLTMPSLLWSLFSMYGYLLNYLPKCGAECLKEFFREVAGREIEGGFIIILQTHGRSGTYNVHLHIIATGGGIDKNSNWFEIRYYPYKLLSKKWQKHLLSMIEEKCGSSAGDYVYTCRSRYSQGFVTYVDTKNTLENCGEILATYLAKYVVTPPISVRRIKDYDGCNVSYVYKSHKTEKVERETVGVYEFIERMVQHIVPKGFKRIRYYGIQAPCKFEKIKETVIAALKKIGRIASGVVKIIKAMNYRQRYTDSLKRDPIICPYCGAEMELFRLWHPKYGTFYEGFVDFIAKSPPNGIAANKVLGYNEQYEQLLLLS